MHLAGSSAAPGSSSGGVIRLDQLCVWGPQLHVLLLLLVSFLFLVEATPWLTFFHFPEVSSKSGSPRSCFINGVVQKTPWCWLTSKWIPPNTWFRTDIQRRIFLRGEIIDVGDAEGLDGGLADPAQNVSQQHVDPHGQVGLALAPCEKLTVTV